MIHVVTADNRALYATQLLQMHRQRKAIFVDRRGWSALSVADDGGEYDQYDDVRAIYLLGLDDEGDVEIAARLRPTTDRSMIGDLFPEFIGPDEPPIGDADVWELTRYYTTTQSREQGRMRRIAELNLTMVEIAARAGITRILSLLDLVIIGHHTRGALNSRLVGLPGAYAEGECAAIEIAVSAERVETIRERYNYRGSPTLEFSANHPLVELGPVQAEAILDAVRRLTPASRRLVTNITRTIAQIEAREGVDAALAAVERVTEVITRDGD